MCCEWVTQAVACSPSYETGETGVTHRGLHGILYDRFVDVIPVGSGTGILTLGRGHSSEQSKLDTAFGPPYSHFDTLDRDFEVSAGHAHPEG